TTTVVARNTVSAILTKYDPVRRKLLVAGLDNGCIRRWSLDRSGNSFLSPHFTHCHDADCDCAGACNLVDAMNRARLIRGIKITWSVLCGLAAMSLVVLWVRSYWVQDTVYMGWRGVSYNAVICPTEGRLGIAIREYDITSGSTAKPLFYFRDQSIIGPNFLRL